MNFIAIAINGRKEHPVSMISESWLTAMEAADLLSEASGRKINHNYLFSLAKRHKVRSIKLHKHATLFSREDCLGCRVKPYQGHFNGGRRRKQSSSC